MKYSIYRCRNINIDTITDHISTILSQVIFSYTELNVIGIITFLIRIKSRSIFYMEIEVLFLILIPVDLKKIRNHRYKLLLYC